MAGVRGLLARVARLEAARSGVSPIEKWYGSMEAFEAEIRTEIDAGKLDARDWAGEDGTGGILACIRAWHRNGVWGKWQQRNRYSELGR